MSLENQLTIISLVMAGIVGIFAGMQWLKSNKLKRAGIFTTSLKNTEILFQCNLGFVGRQDPVKALNHCGKDAGKEPL